MEAVRLAHGFGIPVSAICCIWLFAMRRRHIIDLWDPRTYRIALEREHAGRNPYDPIHKKVPPFVYPPIFLKCAIPLSHIFPGSVEWYFYLLLSSPPLAAFAALLSRNGFAATCVLLLAAILISLFRFRTARHSGLKSATV